jgi:hypothetical protein
MVLSIVKSITGGMVALHRSCSIDFLLVGTSRYRDVLSITAFLPADLSTEKEHRLGADGDGEAPLPDSFAYR